MCVCVCVLGKLCRLLAVQFNVGYAKQIHSKPRLWLEICSIVSCVKTGTLKKTQKARPEGI